MTDDHSEVNLCPKCGKENLPMVTRCVHCGAEMESLFTIFGQPQEPNEETEESLPDIIEEIRNDPALRAPVAPELSQENQSDELSDEPPIPAEQLPDWLAKVRERAREEEGAVGDLVSGINAMDAVRGEEEGVEGEFNAWINRIREKSQQENRTRARQIPDESDEPDQVPEWLQRIRALRPSPEEDATHEVKTQPAFSDGLPREWTDEALAELRRQALQEAGEQETEPLAGSSTPAEELDPPAEMTPWAEAQTEFGQEVPTESKEDFHNIPEDEAEFSEPTQDGSPEQPAEKEIENPNEPAEEQNPETEDAESIEENLAPLEAPTEAELDEEPLTEETLEPAEAESPPPEEVEEPSDSSAVPPDLLLLRDQQDRASLLAALVEQEGRVTADKQPTRKPSSKVGRLVVELLLIIGLVVSIVVGPSALAEDSPKSVPALALNEQIVSLTDGDKVLVVLDYQAAASRELEALAAPVLERLQTEGAALSFRAIQPAGLFLAQSLFEKAAMPESTRVEYLPGSYLNLLPQAVDPQTTNSSNDPSGVEDMRSFKMVLLVSDSAENIRGWLEQIAPWVGSLKFAAVTTQMEAPTLSPYFDSGQLIGYASGTADGTLGTQDAFNYRAYRVGLLLMLVMLLLGIISKVEADAIRREMERSE